jgi:diaminohydroxyphosphoribosylaminopyrimidine deaminase/5-amino-6-(5-phosphoribosylamino)uracil reductase
VTVKAAISLDGRIALPDGQSQWITSPAARRAAHRLRAEHAAVLVGAGTVAQDDPLLTARHPGAVNQPLRIVLDPNKRLPASARVFGPEAETLHVTGPIDLPALVSDLWARGLTSLLVEGGSITNGHFLASGLVDEIHLFLAGKVLGAGPSWVQGAPADPRTLLRGPAWRCVATRRVGPDWELVYRC